MPHNTRSRFRRTGAAVLALGALAAALTACSSAQAATGPDPTGGSDAATKVVIGAHSNGAATQATLTVEAQKGIAAKLPESVRSSGELKIGVGALPAGFPPLAFTGDDTKTLTGAEPDLGRLVAATLGLKPVIANATWDNLFVGIDTGKTDVGFSNITDTEQRKQKYDFASYRNDNLAFEVLTKSTWEFDGKYENLAGLTVAVGSGTNQEKILLEWQSKLQAEDKQLTLKYYPDQNSVNLALASGRIDAYFGPNPGIAYHQKQNKGTANPTRTAGTYSGAGDSLQGLIAATVKKDSGLAEPISEAINHLIDDGQYTAWLKAYNLSNEAVKTSEVNPPGLPLTNQ